MSETRGHSIQSLHLGTQSYVELDERQHDLKSIDSLTAGPRLWSDEVSASDKEKVPTPIEDDGIARVIRH